MDELENCNGILVIANHSQKVPEDKLCVVHIIRATVFIAKRYSLDHIWSKVVPGLLLAPIEFMSYPHINSWLAIKENGISPQRLNFVVTNFLELLHDKSL